MMGWFWRAGYCADIKACRAEYPELLTFGRWLEEESAFENLEKETS